MIISIQELESNDKYYINYNNVVCFKIHSALCAVMRNAR